ncbi:MAG: aminotransferase class IV [Sphingomonadaceae bacterium]
MNISNPIPALIEVERIMATDPDHVRLHHDPLYAHGSAFINGTYIDLDHAAIPITDMGLLQADACYDVVSVSKGQFFRLDDHLDRFERSCAKFRLRNPYSKAETAGMLTRLVQLIGAQSAYVWWFVTRGDMPEKGSDRGKPDAYENRLYAFALPYVFIADDEQRRRGLDVMISRKHIRIPPRAVDPTAKNFHGMDTRLSLFEATDQNADWCVLCDAQGNLTEAAGANIFVVKDGELYTPASGCLEGITRKTIFDLAAELRIPVHRRDIPADFLRNADEAFLTSTAGGIMPIRTVDGAPLAKGSDNRISVKLHNLYWNKRWDGWLGTKIDYNNLS